MMKKVLLTALLACYATVATAEIKRIDGIAALVNQDIVLVSDIEKRLATLYERYANNLAALPAEAVLRAQILEQLITESIQLQMASDAGIVLSEQDIQGALQQVADSQGFNLSGMASQQPQSYAALRRQIEQQLLISQIQRREVSKRFQINQKEVDTFLNTKKGRAAQNKEYRFLYSRYADEQVAKVQRSQLSSDQLMSVEQGATDLGFRTQNKLPSLIQNRSLDSLKPGDTLPPLAGNNAWHLFQLADIRLAQGKMVQQVNARHILIQSDAVFTAEQARMLADKIHDELLAGADFASLAKTYSDDLATRQKGGDLGWSDPDNFVPEFTEALKQLSVSEISPVVASPFGWHIIQLIARRQQDLGEQELRNQVTDAIFQNRFQQELPRWLSEIRDNAYIERRL